MSALSKGSLVECVYPIWNQIHNSFSQRKESELARILVELFVSLQSTYTLWVIKEFIKVVVFT